jgi:hypothetical protein
MHHAIRRGFRLSPVHDIFPVDHHPRSDTASLAAYRTKYECRALSTSIPRSPLLNPGLNLEGSTTSNEGM